MIKSGAEMGRLHECSVAFAKRGPWSFLRIETCPDDDDAAAGFGGYCHICGQGLKAALVFLENTRTGEVVTVGQDCAVTLCDNIEKLRAGLANARFQARTRKLVATRRRTAEEITEEKLLALAELDRLTTHHPTQYGRSFGADVARRIREGVIRTLSPAQKDLLAKLFDECLTDEQLAAAQVAEEQAYAEHLETYAEELTALDKIACSTDASEWERGFAKDVAAEIRRGFDLSGGQRSTLLKLRKRVLGYREPREPRKRCARCRVLHRLESLSCSDGKTFLCSWCAEH